MIVFPGWLDSAVHQANKFKRHEVNKNNEPFRTSTDPLMHPKLEQQPELQVFVHTRISALACPKWCLKSCLKSASAWPEMPPEIYSCLARMLGPKFAPAWPECLARNFRLLGPKFLARNFRLMLPDFYKITTQLHQHHIPFCLSMAPGIVTGFTPKQTRLAPEIDPNMNSARFQAKL